MSNSRLFEEMMIKFLTGAETQTPAPIKYGDDSETAYEKIWDRFKQIEVNDKALKMHPLKKNHCHCDEKDTKEYVEENNIEKEEK